MTFLSLITFLSLLSIGLTQRYYYGQQIPYYGLRQSSPSKAVVVLVGESVNGNINFEQSVCIFFK
jgi:hypothetical protein